MSASLHVKVEMANEISIGISVREMLLNFDQEQ